MRQMTKEGRERQLEALRRGSQAIKHYTPETKARLIAGAIKGGSKLGKKRRQGQLVTAEEWMKLKLCL